MASRYDGVSYVTQCPIAPGTNFTYTIPVNDPPGTYFWHEHSSLMRADGLQVSSDEAAHQQFLRREHHAAPLVRLLATTASHTRQVMTVSAASPLEHMCRASNRASKHWLLILLLLLVMMNMM
jgi:hypothetical protein